MPSRASRALLRVLCAGAMVGTFWVGVVHASRAVAQETAVAAEPRIGFAFKNAPFDQVLDFFSRQSGVPIIFEADAPAGEDDGIEGYTQHALARVWKSERFSWSLTKLMHRFPEDGPFERRMQMAELDYIFGSEAAQKTIAENYVGLPL